MLMPVVIDSAAALAGSELEEFVFRPRAPSLCGPIPELLLVAANADLEIQADVGKHGHDKKIPQHD
jgi:hypothetical protein